MTRIHRTARLLAATLLLACAAAQAQNVDKPLAEDEGWLLVKVENNLAARAVVIDGPGLRDKLADLQPGSNLQLIRARAGEYRWSRAGKPAPWSRYLIYQLEPRKYYTFSVKPGVINYPGDLTLLERSYDFAQIRRSNSVLQAMMALDAAHPGLRARLPWRSDVTSPDPFPAFAATLLPAQRSRALQESSAADAKKTSELVIDQRFSDLYADLYARPRVGQVWLSPDGALLAFRERRAKGEAVVVVDMASGVSADALATDGEITYLAWGGDRLLYAQHYTSVQQLIASLPPDRKRIVLGNGGKSGLHILRIADAPLSEKSITRVFIRDALDVVDPVPDDPRRGLIWRRDSNGEAHVFAVDETAADLGGKDFRIETREDRGLEDVVNVFTDANGKVRAAIVAQEERRALAVRGSDGKWQVHAALPQNIDLTPVLISEDGSYLAVLTSHERAQTELVKLRLEDGQLGDTLLSVPGADLVGVIQRTRGRAIIGARYYSGGVLRERYMDATGDKALADAAGKFPGSEVHVVDDSRDGRRNLLLVRSETDRGAYYLLDRKARRLEKLLDIHDPLKLARPFASKAFVVKAPDGLSVQSFITLPAVVEKAPLVVMPHGGPIGVSDKLNFDRRVQMLASSGFAVLRINFRGSGGAGRAFAEAGEGRWGREIEADVDLAVTHALENFPLDTQRVALLGHGYGGYSTLMGLINKPERYRCGVAIAAVTDLPLMLSAGAFTNSEKMVARMKKTIGDPATEMDMLVANSPVYQYTKINRPLLLIHGTHDGRIAFEHAWRLRSLLAAAGKPPAWLPIPGGDHSLARPEDELAVAAASDRFLKDCFAAQGVTP